jgi:predicted lactoylglutathione lyase
MKKYKNFKIENTPVENFPEMVTVTKGKKINKRFINEKKAIIWIDEHLTVMLIERGKRKVNDELDSVGLLSFADEY